MGDKDKSKAQLINELMELRQRLIQLEKSEYEFQRTAGIAQLLNLSNKAIEVHRKNIRKKLGLRSRKENLRTHLLALQ